MKEKPVLGLFNVWVVMQPKHAVVFAKKALQQTLIGGFLFLMVGHKYCAFLIRDPLHAIGIRNFIWFNDRLLKSTALLEQQYSKVIPTP